LLDRLTPPRRASERDFALAAANFIAGEDWTLSDAVWVVGGEGGFGVKIVQDGDVLSHKGKRGGVLTPVFSRSPLPHLIPGPNMVGISEARAVCGVAMRGDHRTLYGPSCVTQ
jgi:hypothetical protein